MDQHTKINKHAVLSAIFGILSISYYPLAFILTQVCPPPDGHVSPLMGAAGPIIFIHGISSMFMPFLGLVFGAIGLSSIKKSNTPQRGVILAWTGIVASCGHLLVLLIAP